MQYTRRHTGLRRMLSSSDRSADSRTWGPLRRFLLKALKTVFILSLVLLFFTFNILIATNVAQDNGSKLPSIAHKRDFEEKRSHISETRVLLNIKPLENSLVVDLKTPPQEDNVDHVNDEKGFLSDNGKITESEESVTSLFTELNKTDSIVSMTPNEILHNSYIILINVESSCALDQLIPLFQAHYIDIPIYLERSKSTNRICDDYEVTSLTLRCVTPSDDCTGSCFNNYIIDMLHSRKAAYVFIWDASYIFTDAHLLAWLARNYVESNATIISPCIDNYCNSTHGILVKNTDAGELSVLPKVQPSHNSVQKVPTCHYTEVIPPVFLAKTDLLMRHLFDKTTEPATHLNLLLSLKKNKVPATICKDVSVQYNSTCPTENGRMREFAEQWLVPSPKLFVKWKLKTIYNGIGSTCIFYESMECSFNNWLSLNISDPMYLYAQEAVIHHKNDQSPGWMNIRSRESPPHKLAYMYTSPCVIRINGTLNIEYDRSKGFSNKNHTLNVEHFHLNRSCTMLQGYWRLSHFGKLKRRQVYYVTAVSNDTEYMGRLLQLVNSQTDLRYTNLVIVDMSRPGNGQFNISRFPLKVAAHYHYLGAPFSRSIGLKKGFAIAQLIAQEKSHEDPVLFSIDTSMVIPNNFTRLIWQNTRCGVSTYAPICYKQRGVSEGFWVQYGYGMLGLCASDYRKSGGWDSRWGYHWGAEDVDLMHRMQEIVPYTCRIKESNYKHSHTEENRIYSKLYYSHKNVYPYNLPVTPVTQKVTDQTLKNSLADYALKRMKYSSGLQLTDIYETSKYKDSGVLYDLRFTNSLNEEYYALIQAL